MQVDYIHGNPLKIRKPSMAEIKKVWGNKVASKLAKLTSENPKKATKKVAVKKSSKKIIAKRASSRLPASRGIHGVLPIKVVAKTPKKITRTTSSKITLEEAKELFKPKSQGGSRMAKKKRSAAQKAATKKLVAHNKAKRAKKVTRKVKRKVAKKHVAKKHVRKVAKKHVAKKHVRKVAKKHVKKHAKKGSRKAKRAKLRKGVSSLRHAVAVRKYAAGHKVKKGKDVYVRNASTRATKMPMPVRLLKKGEEVDGTMTRTIKRKGKPNKTKTYEAKIVRTNPKRRKHKRNPIVVSKNPIVVSNPKRRRKHKKNPIKFMKNPLQATMQKMDSILDSKLNMMMEKYLSVGIVEVVGLGLGAGFDGLALNTIKALPFGIGAKVDSLVLSKIPAEYQAPAVTVMAAGLIHGLNFALGKLNKNSGSKVLTQLGNGLLLSAIVKSVAAVSPFSSVNNLSSPVAGYMQFPHMSGYIQSNPSASMPVGKSDFSGADFQGADFQGHDNVGGADFDGYVQSMGDADMDFGTDAHSMSGNW
jgi:hypothetical protein